MSHPVRFLKSAESEYLDLPLPIQNDILEKVKMLREFPYMGVVMEKSYEGYRSLLVGRRQYRIIYRVLDSGIVKIAYIRHCRRQMELRPVH